MALIAKTDSDAEPGRAKAGRPGKRDSILDAARAVFGSDGYARTSIDAIAARAEVSTRTIYNHFDGKEELFSAALEASASRVAEGFVAKAEKALALDEPIEALHALGRAFAAQRTDFPEHFAMVAQIRAEAAHFPPELIQRWREAGPLLVHGELARCLRELTGRGALAVADADLAAVHFGSLVTAGLTQPYESRPPSRRRIGKVVEAGVAAFVDGYGTRPRRR